MSYQSFLNAIVIVLSLQISFAGTSFAEEAAAETPVALNYYKGHPVALLSDIETVANLHPAGAEALMADLKKMANSYKRNQLFCSKSQSAASAFCREKTSPKLQEILNIVNTASSTVNMSGILDACSELGKMANLVNTGLTAYTTTCSGLRGTCTAFCSSVQKVVEKIVATKGQVGELKCTPGATICEAGLEAARTKLSKTISTIETEELSNKTNETSIAGKSKACEYDYGNMVTSATMGMIQMVNSMKQAKSCTDAADGTGVDKCLDAEVAKTDRECICRFYPRTAGCDSALSATSASNESSKLMSAAIDKKKEKDLGALSGADEDSISPVANNASGSGMAGAPTGGGGGFGGGGGGGSGSGGEGAGGPGGSPLNSKIINGFSGGGGGGFGGRSSASTDAYRAYLPGGKKDPALNVAGQELWKKEVTGQGGKSNWDKVRDRYRDNRSTLIGN